MSTLKDNALLSQSVFGTRSHLSVLRCLDRSMREASGREIARRAGLSHQQAHNALRQLVALGLVERRVAPPSHLFCLNTKHWFVQEVLRTIWEKEKRWLDNMMADIIRDRPHSAVSLILFGSAAIGRLHGGSDVDLLVLVNRVKDKKSVLNYFTAISPNLFARYHFPVAPVVMTVEEFRKRYAGKNDFTRAIVKTGNVVWGKMLTEIL